MNLTRTNTNSNAERTMLKELQGNTAGTVIESKAAKKTVKRLSYNYKKISSQLLRAKTSGSAGQAVMQARTQAAQLRKKLRTGEYDDRELESAILHAERIVRIAKKKEKNLMEEERVRKEEALGGESPDDGDDNIHEGYLDEPEVRNRREYGRMVKKLQKILDKLNDERAEEMKAEMGDFWDDLGTDIREDIDSPYFFMMKKKHRSDEFREVTEADMNYLKSRFSGRQREKETRTDRITPQPPKNELPVREIPTEPAASSAETTGSGIDFHV